MNMNLLMIVHVADILVNSYRDDSGIKIKHSEIYPDALSAMGLQIDTVSDWFPEVLTEAESACKFFLEEEG